MPVTHWTLVGGRPVVILRLTARDGVTRAERTLLADTGAGTAQGAMELVLTEADRIQFSVRSEDFLQLGGAFSGRFPTFWVRASILPLGFSTLCLAVAVPSLGLSHGLQGIACFRFLNRFTYGNFGDPTRFGLETP